MKPLKPPFKPILIATDAASEGIDLHNHCSRLILNEIPWNPNRLEQRNGRIDRHGQRAAEVNIYHFVGSRLMTANSTPFEQKTHFTSVLDADLEFLWIAVNKINQIREGLGNVGPVIADQVEEAMLGNRHTLDTKRDEERSPSRHMRAFERKRKQVEERVRQLYEQLQESKRELKLTPENIQAVVETALELAKQPPLQRATLHDPHGNYGPIEVFHVPDLSGSWAQGTNGLEHPHTHQRRPIVFDHDLAQGRDDVVLAHLNHRLVAMSLRLLRAEVWANGEQRKLYRVTARTVPNNTLDTISHDMQQRLSGIWPQHQDALAQSLDVRMHELASRRRRQLAERSEKEQRDIRAILTELKESIGRELRESSGPMQMSLMGFSTEERQQFERDLSALEQRVQQIDEEIAQEVARIQQRFADPQPRLFPVTVTYLVPERLAR